MSKPATTPLFRFFQPKTDFFELLAAQAASTEAGMIGFHEWLKSGARGRCDVIHEMEHKADQQKRDIQKKLRDTFATPLDSEDIYDISAQMDLVINNAKKLVKDIEVFDEGIIDECLIEMSGLIAEGMNLNKESIENLSKDVEQSEQLANKARKTDPHTHNKKRVEMKKLYDKQDLDAIVKRQPLYDRMCTIAECVERLGERLMHISIKLG
jgi:hypothetical protein